MPAARAPSRVAHLRGAPGPLGGGTGPCQSGFNSANPVSTPRAAAGGPSPPLRASRPHSPTHSPLPFSPRRRQPSPAPAPPPEDASSPGRGAEPAAHRAAAAQYRGAARAITAPQDRRRARPASGVRPQPGTRGPAHLSGPAAPHSQARSPVLAPARSARGAAARRAPSSTPGRTSPGAPLPGPPGPPPPNRSSTAGGSGGRRGRRPGARKRPDRRVPRTPYLGERRGGDGGRARE